MRESSKCFQPERQNAKKSGVRRITFIMPPNSTLCPARCYTFGKIKTPAALSSNG
jgi:hypothetical protein